MKKIAVFLLCASLVTGCGGGVGTGSPIAAGGQLSGEITVSTFSAMPHKVFLETAAKMFEEKYPGTKINVDVYSSMPEVKTMESGDGKMVSAIMVGGEEEDAQRPDYINKITTEMMGGGGPDVMAVDSLPYYSYALGGQIEPLDAFMDADADFDLNDYRSNILDAMRIDGGLYVLPLDYSFELVAYDPSLFSQTAVDAMKAKDSITYDEMVELAAPEFDANAGERMFGMIGAGQLFNSMLNADYGRFTDIPGKKAAFDDGAFAKAMDTAKDYESKGYVLPGSMRDGVENSAEDTPTVYFKTVHNTMLMNYLSNYYDPAKTGGMKNRIVMNGSSLEDSDELLGLLTNSEGEMPFTFTQAYAINSNSANKALAWEFLKFLAGEQAQESGMMSGIPLNKKAAEAKARLDASGQGRMAGVALAGTGEGKTGGPVIKTPEGGENGPVIKTPEGGENGPAMKTPEGSENGPVMKTPEGGENVMKQSGAAAAEAVVLTEAQEKVFEAYLALITKYSDMLNTFFVKDPTVDTIIRTEAENYFGGMKSAEEAAQVIQNKVGLYLSE